VAGLVSDDQADELQQIEQRCLSEDCCCGWGRACSGPGPVEAHQRASRRFYALVTASSATHLCL
jgi:hypothetical protein